MVVLVIRIAIKPIVPMVTLMTHRIPTGMVPTRINAIVVSVSKTVNVDITKKVVRSPRSPANVKATLCMDANRHNMSRGNET
jgi:hypothetical protein